MTNKTWALNRAMNELVARHGVTLPSPQAVALTEPSGPMVLSGLASTLDTDIERVQFAPFAFQLKPDVPLHYDHRPIVAGRIETLAFSDKGELLVRAYVDHPEAVRCNAFSVNGDVLDYTLHHIDSPNFVARVERIRLREISLVPAPINCNARVLKRELPSPASCYAASALKQFDLLLAGTRLLQKQISILQEHAHA